MKKYILITSLLFAFSFCKKEENIIVEEKEFVARNSDFEGWRNWTIVKKTTDTALLANSGGAHLSRVPNSQRWVYIKDNASKATNGEYPVGTLIVKEYRKTSGDTINTFYVAMAKRGKNFNPGFGNWEWFHIDPITLKIRLAGGGVNAEYRGATLFTNTCNNCHIAAKSKDFVFSKD